MRTLIILPAVLLMCILSTLLHAQEIVVSEYRNSTEQDAEWTEVVVISDNVDLRGYVITDNRGGGDMRQSGPRFRFIPFWQHVRAGTIILIYHGPESLVQNMDEDPADGYLELSQLDLTYFDIVNVDGAPGSTGLNINQDRDFVQILKPDTSHVHGLMHGRPAGDTWDATPAPKAGYDTSNIGPRSICVSGRSLAAYAAGRNKDSTSTGRYMTPGLPNSVDERKRQAGLSDVNYLFWQELRQPEWTSAPTITLDERTISRHVISWTPTLAPYEADRTSGYLVLRDTNNFASFPPDAIIDGQIYTVGESFGSAVVLDIVSTLQGASYADTKDLACGTSYTYRVYAFRFGADDQLGEADPGTARSRQYNPTFAQSAPVLKPNPPKPTIAASRLQICPGDTVSLTTTTTDAISYQWMLNGSPISVVGSTRIVVSEAGSYSLTITADGGCSATSAPVAITALPAPSVDLSPIGIHSMCNGDTLLLRANTPAPSYEWRRNGIPIPGATSQTYPATQAGDYQVLIQSQAGCPGISKVARVTIPDVRYSFLPSSVDFGTLGACQSSTSRTVELVNDGSDQITVGQVVMPPGFALVAPAPGFVVRPGERTTLTLLFAPSGTGVTSGVAVFRVSPCAVQRSLNLRGERAQGEVSLDRAGIDFGIFTACPTSDVRQAGTFVLTNSGADPVTVRAPLVSPPFYLLTQFTSVDLAPGASYSITVQYRPLGADLDRGVNDVIGFPFTSVSCRDTLQASLIAASFFPRLALKESDVSLGFVLGCVGYVDTLVDIQNTSAVDASITGNTNASVVLAGLPVAIPAGETRSIRARITPPAGTGGFVVRDTIIGQACNQKLAMRYSGNWFAATFIATPQTIDLDDVSLCGGADSSESSFTITAQQTNGLRATVTSVDVSAPFSVDLQAGTTIVTDLVVNVAYSPSVAGVDVDTVVVVFGPCSDTVRVIVRARATTASRTTEISDADFGTVADGGTSQRRLVIRNTGASDLPVEALSGLVPPFSLASSTPTLPTVLSPGDSVVAVLEYVFFTYDRKDTAWVVSATTGLCADSITIQLTGATTSRPPLDGIVIVIPENLTARIGEVVLVPVQLASSVPLQGAGLMQLDVDVLYNGSIFKIEEVATTAPNVSAVVAELSPGRAVITIRGSELIAADPLVVLRGRTFLGGDRSTPIAVAGVASNTGTVTGDDGMLTLVGDCAVETQVIALGTPPSIAVHSAQADHIALAITTLTDEQTTIRLSNLRGSLEQESVFTVRPGRHLVTLTTQSLPAGAYLIQMIHGRFVGTASVIISR